MTTETKTRKGGWTAAEIETLRQLLAAKVDDREIAARLGKTLSAVRNRVYTIERRCRLSQPVSLGGPAWSRPVRAS